MRIGVLGATGRAGRTIALTLIENGVHDVVLIGRDNNRLEQLQQELESVSTVSPAFFTVSLDNSLSLNLAFKSIDMVVIAISSAEKLPSVIDAALDTKTDCLDIFLCSDRKRLILESYQQKIHEAGIVYITDGGYHPGVPAAMARFAEQISPGLSTINIYSSFGVDWGEKTLSEQAMITFMEDVLSTKMCFLEEGKWCTGMKVVRFSLRDKNQHFFPIDLDEMRFLTTYIPTLKNAGFFAAGFGVFIDYIMVPIFLFLVKISPRFIGLVARMFAFTLKMLCNNERFALLHLRGEGSHEEIEITISHGDAYGLTALPVVACLKQYTENRAKPGVYRQAIYVEPLEFINDLKSMGVSVNLNRIPKK
ncbi:saccharopine dehydrogenase NADP-binding domain-containing protein [Citrobacter youngae]|uniref:saccharopine dehydrogenase NADP-binding domain-containing protein n=1 Tax=Citrobacter youngae TaxID=133448 RepID=UPI0039B47A4E